MNLPTSNQPTPSRASHLSLDQSLPVMVNSPWGLVLNGQNIGIPSDLVKYSEAHGWTLNPRQISASQAHELSEGNTVVIKSQADGGTLQVAQGIRSRLAHRKPSELTGVLTGASSALAETSDYLLGRTVAAGTSWVSDNMTTQQNAFPGIDIPTNGVIQEVRTWSYKLLRIAEDTIQQKGFQPFSFKFLVTGTKLNQKDVIFVLYFCGPPSKTELYTGTGRYAMAFMGDGSLEMWEYCFLRGDNIENPYEWRKNKKMNHTYSSPGQVVGNLHQIIVVPQHGVDNYTKLNTGDHKMTLYVTNSARADNPWNKLGFFGLDPVMSQITIPVEQNVANTDPTAVEPMPFRVSTNASLRAEFQLSYLSYPVTGMMETINFKIPTACLPTDRLTVHMYGDYPSGTDIEAQLYTPSATGGAGFPLYSSQATENRLSQTFTLTDLPEGESTFFLRLYFSGSAYTEPTHKKIFIPKLRKLHLVKPGQLDTHPASGFTITWPAILSDVAFQGPTADPSQESADFQIADPGNQYSRLLVRGEFPIKLSTEYESSVVGPVDFTAEPDRKAVLFQGYATRVKATRRGSNIKNLDGTTPSYPAQEWREYSLSCQGEYKRLVETLSTFNWDFSIDTENDTFDPPFVVNVIKTVLNWAGYESHQIDFGEGSTADAATYPVKLFPRGQSSESTTIQAGTDWGSFLKTLCRDYLGAALVFCPNSYAGSWDNQYSSIKGAWRLIHPQLAPFTNLAHFTTSPPNIGALGVVSPHVLAAYPASGGVPVVPIYKDSLESEVTPPEVNKVVVTGTGEISPTPLKQTNQLTMFAVNTISYNYLNQPTADPDHPDFLGRERAGYKVDPLGINTPQACQWVLRRTFDIAAHALKNLSFVAPLILVKPQEDTALKRPRPLRFYDPVLFDGHQYLIRSVSVVYTKDNQQLARYELTSVPPRYLVPGLGV